MALVIKFGKDKRLEDKVRNAEFARKKEINKIVNYGIAGFVSGLVGVGGLSLAIHNYADNKILPSFLGSMLALSGFCAYCYLTASAIDLFKKIKRDTKISEYKE